MLQTIGILIALASIIFLSARKINFGIAILLGSAVICITSGVTLGLVFEILLEVFSDISTYELVLDVALIAILGFALKETQLIGDMIQDLRKILPRKVLIALIPAIFGLMPMPGGALVSAPLIDKEATELGLVPERKAFVNLWFRHLSILIVPISSSLIFTAKIANVNIYSLIFLQIPTFLFMTLLGCIFLIRMIHGVDRREEGTVSFKTIILGVMPILVAIILNLIGLWLPFALSIGVLTVFLIKRNRIRPSSVIIWRGLNKGLVLTTFCVMIFRGVVTSTQAFNEILVTLQQIGVPSMLFMTALPFLIGFVAAVPTSGVAMAFPLLLPFFSDMRLPMISLIYQSIIFGYEISPMHLCLILTNEYYHSKIQSIYRTWGPMVLSTYLFSLFVFVVISGFV